MANPLPKPNLPGQVPLPVAKPVSKAIPTPLFQAKPGISSPGQLPRPPLNNQAPLPPVSPMAGKPGAQVPPQATKPGVAASAKPPVFAKAKNSPLKFLPIILGVLVLLAVLFFAATRFLGGGSNQSISVSQGEGASSEQVVVDPSKQVVLTYWGLWESNAVVEGVLEEFGQQNPGVIVEYKKHSHTEYRERLQSAIAAGNGPDVFRFHASWTPMIRAELESMPASVMSAAEFKRSYYPVATDQLISGNRILGVPLMYDGLALYYNKKAFDAANIDVPRSWSQLKTAANKLTIRSDEKIERAGVALGTAANVEHFSDVLALLMLQNGADLNSPSSKEAQQALRFYTDFYIKSKVWDEDMPSSTVAFASDKVAMMFAPSWRAHEVQAINPDLDFDIVPIPKLTESHVAWASFWAEGVSSQSKNKDLAWKLIDYLSSAEVLKKMYSAQSQTRAFGEIYPRVDMADELIDSKFVSSYLEDAPMAAGGYMNSYTHDNGINDRMISYYEDAVNAVATGTDLEIAMDIVASGSAQVLRQYGVSSSR
ncbi:MAG: extracellular solute-binding protein [Patescibacteria group bacterium]